MLGRRHPPRVESGRSVRGPGRRTGWVLLVLAIVAGSTLAAAVAGPAVSRTGPPQDGLHPASPGMVERAPVVGPAAAQGPSSVFVHRLSAVVLGPDSPANGIPATPAWLAYDLADQSFYVAVAPSGVDIIPGNFSYVPAVSATIPVGNDPFGVAYDNRTGDLFVTNAGSGNVSVLSGTLARPISAIPVGAQPRGVAYDPVNREVYVANNASDNVTVINASTLQVVASVPVGSNPIGVAADPATGDVFVANHGSSNVSVISGATNRVVRTDPTPAGPYGVAVDNRTDTVFVSDEAAGNLSVISGTSLAGVANISVSVPPLGIADLQGIAYDVADGLVWVGAGATALVAIDPINDSVRAVVNMDPSGVAYDPNTGDLCVTNTANTTFECAQFLGSRPLVYSVAFNATGLAPGLSWNVTISGVLVGTSSAGSFPVQFYLRNGSYTFGVGAPYGWTPAVPTGTFRVAGAPVALNVTFVPVPEYGVAWIEQGLPTGTPWNVTVGGGVGTLSPTGTTLLAALTNGSYPFTVGSPSGFFATPAQGLLTVAGANETERIGFAPALANGMYRLSFRETGLPNGTGWGVALGGALETSSTPTVSFAESNGTYAYVILAVTDYVANSSGTVRVNGSNTSVAVMFQPQSYPVVFVEFGLPNGSRWNVTATNVTQGFNRTASSVTDAVTIDLPNGTYSIRFTVPPGYTVTFSPDPVTVGGASGNQLTVIAHGPPGPAPESGASGIPLSWVVLFVGAAVAATAIVVWLLGRRGKPPA